LELLVLLARTPVQQAGTKLQPQPQPQLQFLPEPSEQQSDYVAVLPTHTWAA
jgi:hypothetical protein